MSSTKKRSPSSFLPPQRDISTGSCSEPYRLLDHRLANQVVQIYNCPTTRNISKLAVPSWHPAGGLICSGTKDEEEGVLNIWDVRWNQTTQAIRPVGFDQSTAAHLQKRYSDVLPKTQVPGLPTQSLSLGGQRIVQALFHPTQNIMMTLNSSVNDSLAFWYVGIEKPKRAKKKNERCWPS